MELVQSVSLFYGGEHDIASVRFHYSNGQTRQLNNVEAVKFMELVETESKRTDMDFTDPDSVRKHVANAYFHQ